MPPQSQDSRALSKEARHSLGFDQLARLLEMVVNNRVGVDAERMINAGEKFHRVNGIFRRAAAGFIRLAMNVSFFDTGARDD
jgi:hypothetical protein